MATMRRLTSIRLTKIAAVDSPCQEHATVAIMKRGPAAGAEQIAKATFQQALDGQLVASRVSEVFYRAFDGLYSRNDAFRTALIDEFNAGGDGTQASADYLSSIKGLAEDAVAAARETGAAATDEQLTEAVGDAVAKYLSRSKETVMFKTKAELLAGIAKFATAGGTQIEIDAIRKAAVDLGAVADLPNTGALALSPTDSVFAADLSKMKADLAKRDALDGMTADVRKHYDALDAAGQTAFLAKSKDEREAEVIAKNAVDPVVYTATDGTQIRKSDGGVVLAMAKRLDGVEAENKVLKAANGEADIAKRAAEFKHLPNPEVIVKSLDGIADEGERAKALAGFRAADKALSPLFKRAGTTTTTLVEGEADSPIAKINTLATDLAKAKGITVSAAMVEVMATEAGATLYAEAYPIVG